MALRLSVVFCGADRVLQELLDMLQVLLVKLREMGVCTNGLGLQVICLLSELVPELRLAGSGVLQRQALQETIGAACCACLARCDKSGCQGRVQSEVVIALGFALYVTW